MRKITFFFFLLLSTLSFAQFTPNDVKYFVGTGSSTAYLVIDFKDDTDDRSYAWGIRFDENQPINGIEMLELLAQEEPNFSFDQSGGFLDQIAFNHHDSYEMEYDYWSLWASVDGTTWNMDGWMSTDLVDGKWYGASYGFGMAIPGPTAPITPIPAYSSQWLSHADITTWIGTGSNESLVVIDLGTTTNDVANSYVFGIKYNGTLTAQQALNTIQTTFPAFTYNLNGNILDAVTLANHTIANTPSTLYKGTNLSNWITEGNFNSLTLSNNEWLGISFGNRRPFTPQDGNTLLSNKHFQTVEFTAYPNPTSNLITIALNEEIKNVTVYNLMGAQVMNASSNQIDLSHLSSGTYIMKVTTEKGIGTQKIIKK
nr:T9SS type A sorting domain-containing protein [uncultured Flavobacterium sp.]